MSGDPILAQSRVVFERAAIADAVARIADAVTARCAGHDPVVLSVLLGGLPFTAALIARLEFRLQLDYAQVARYRGSTRGGRLEWLREPQLALAGRQVLVVDDVLDDGDTLAEITRWCRARGAAEVVTTVLVEKRSHRRPAGLAADWTGLYAADEYLFGFGMDYRERYRQLPEIRALPQTLDDSHG